MNTELNDQFGFDISDLKVYSGFYKDNSMVYASSSGGAATALSECVIDQGGVVFGVKYTDDFKGACYACAESQEELIQFKTSKYISSEKKIKVGDNWISVFSEVDDRLREGKKVLFIGLGCEVGAVLKYMENHQTNTDKLYTIDLICHGPTYPEVQKQYIEALESKYDAKVKTFSVRYKAKGWTPPFIHAELDNNRVFEEIFYESDFGYAFKTYSRSSCYQCQFRGNNHRADLTIGDYWGCTQDMEEYNPLGVSIIFSRNDKGEKLMEQLSSFDNFDLRLADINLALSHNPAFYMKKEKNENQYNRFKVDFEKYGLRYAVLHSDGYKAHQMRIRKRKIKDLIPPEVIRLIRKIRNR